MQDLLQLIMNGVALGSVYALAALGFVIVYTSTGIVNFASGQFVMLGAFAGVTTVMQWGLPKALGYLTALALMAVFGLAFYLGVHLPLRKRAPVTIIIATVMVGIAMHNAAHLIWGAWPVRMESPLGDGIIEIFGSAIAVHALATIAITALLILGLYFLMQRTLIGRSMRAVAQDQETARLMGLPVGALLAFSWMLGSVLATCAGLLVSPIWFAEVGMGDAIALKAFAATIMGGFGSIHGAIAGGLAVGLIEVLGASYLSSAYKDLLAFAAMIVFLIIRPQGLFGEPISDRG